MGMVWMVAEHDGKVSRSVSGTKFWYLLIGTNSENSDDAKSAVALHNGLFQSLKNRRDRVAKIVDDCG
jgi:hypothetical protein